MKMEEDFPKYLHCQKVVNLNVVYILYINILCMQYYILIKSMGIPVVAQQATNPT